tara:strand:+ start:72 stop:389 length:318 start_codon:yes stop_codon:yes gene_type:complete
MMRKKSKVQKSEVEELSESPNRKQTLPLSNRPISRGFIATGIILSGVYAIARVLPQTRKLSGSVANSKQLKGTAFTSLKVGANAYKATNIISDFYRNISGKLRGN